MGLSEGPRLNHADSSNLTDVQRTKRCLNFLLGLVDLPQRQTGIPVRCRIHKIAAVDRHLNHAIDGAEVKQFAADPACPAVIAVRSSPILKKIGASGLRRNVVGLPPTASVIVCPSQETSTPCCHSNALFRSIIR